jgi:hypothetical protein
VQQAGQQPRGRRFPADVLGTTALAEHHGAAAGKVEVGDVEREDLVRAGRGLIEHPHSVFSRSGWLAARNERSSRWSLLRLAVGYSYHEIAAAEDASYSTTNKQMARAKRLLRELDHAQGGE